MTAGIEDKSQDEDFRIGSSDNTTERCASAYRSTASNSGGRQIREADCRWTSVFGKLAGTVEECRAILVSEYLMDNKELLGIFGYTDTGEVTADDLLYTTYLNIGVDGLQALEHYNFQDKAWGQVHHQAHFSILKYLLQNGDGVIHISHDTTKYTLTVHIDRTKILSHGKPALGWYLCHLHIWRCSADVSSFKQFYEPMCAVEGVYEQWQKIVCSKPNPRWKFVQPNTFVKEGVVEVKVYEKCCSIYSTGVTMALPKYFDVLAFAITISSFSISCSELSALMALRSLVSEALSILRRIF